MQKSVTRRLALTTGISIAILFAIFIDVTSNIISAASRKTANADISIIANSYSTYVTSWLDENLNLLDFYTKADVVHNSGSPEEIGKWLTSTVSRRSSELDYVLFISASGSSFYDSGRTGNHSDRAYFREVMKGADYYITNPTLAKATGKVSIMLVKPAFDSKGYKVGMFVGVKLIDKIQNKINLFSLGDKGYAFMLSGDGTAMCHPSVEIQMKSNFLTDKIEGHEDIIPVAKSMVEGNAASATINSFVEEGQKDVIFYAPVEKTNWSVAIALPKSQLNESANKIRTILILCNLVVCAIVMLLIFILMFRALKPLGKISETIQENTNKIMQGRTDFTKRIEVKNRDEIGAVAEGFNAFSDKLVEIMNVMSQTREKEREMGAQLFEEAQNLAVSTKETASTSQDSAAAVKEIVATMEDSNILSENISRKIKDVSSVANATSADVSEGVLKIEENVNQLHEIYGANQQTIEGIKNLSDKIENIWDIVTLINNVADQAKIIAFNAELEASSAGEAGKSFRIVANEIRRLSDGIIDGTREIKEKITEIQHSSDALLITSESGTEKINAGYENARGLEQKFDSIKKSAEITAKSSYEISDIIQQQTTASEQILIALREISGGVENFTVATDNISSSAENVRKISSDLNNMAKEI